MFAADILSLDIIQGFIIENYISLIGACIALCFLYLEFKASIWLWPVGILSPLFYIYISYQDNFYGNILINIYYLLASIWGWYSWYKNRNVETGENQDPIISISLRNQLISLIIALPLFYGLYYLTINYNTSSPIPWADALATTISFIAMIWLAKKWQEHWLCWIVADLLSSIVFYKAEDYISAVVFLIYSVVAIIGYFHWRKLAKETKDETLS